MRIISRKAFRMFWEKHPEAESSLSDFYLKIKRLEAYSPIDVRQAFPGTDKVGDCFVFNVGGNKYRVIIHLDFEVQSMWIRFVLSHAEYDKDRWKADC